MASGVWVSEPMDGEVLGEDVLEIGAANVGDSEREGGVPGQCSTGVCIGVALKLAELWGATRETDADLMAAAVSSNKGWTAETFAGCARREGGF